MWASDICGLIGSNALIYGHRAKSMCVNTLLPLEAVLWLVLAIAIGKMLANAGFAKRVLQAGAMFLYVIFLPNAVYLATEVRHLWLADQVAEPVTLGALLFLGAFSVLGTVLYVGTVMLDLFKGPYLQTHPWEKLAVLSTLSSAGTRLGLGLVNTNDIWYRPHVVVREVLQVLNHPKEIFWIGIGALVLFLIAGIVYWVMLAIQKKRV